MCGGRARLALGGCEVDQPEERRERERAQAPADMYTYMCMDMPERYAKRPWGRGMGMGVQGMKVYRRSWGHTDGMGSGAA